jgi:DNA-binding PadR family transcriptional regulator
MPVNKKSKPGRSNAADAHTSRNGLREAILGLLSIRPMSGYDVSRSYKRALQQIWYAPLGQVYPTLRKMQADGLLSVSVEFQHDKPNRKVYRLTAQGQRILVKWLSQPSALPNMHHEFIHKLFLLNHIEPERRIKLVQNYIDRSKAWLVELIEIEQKLAAASSRSESAWYQLMALRHLIRVVRTEAQSAKIIFGELAAHTKVVNKRKDGSARRSGAGKNSAAVFARLSLSPKNGTGTSRDDELEYFQRNF